MSGTEKLQALLADTKLGYSLPQGYYLDPEIYALEIEQIFMKNWLHAGHVSQIPNAGDYFLFEFDKESIIVVRNKEGDVNAFMNVCRHRGSHICLEKEGSVKLLTCPYHAWSFDLDGQLKAAREMPEDFDKSKWGLHTVKVEIVSGLIYVALSDDVPSLDKAKEDLAAPFEMFGLDKLKQVAQKSYDIDGNWKLSVENYQECYHCAPSHPEYAERHALKLDNAALEPYQQAMEDDMEACGLKHYEFEHHYSKNPYPDQQGYHYSRTAMFEGFKSGSEDGEALAPLLGQLTGFNAGASDMFIEPISFFLIYNDHMVGYRFVPTSHHKSRCDIFWFVREDAVEGKDYDLEKLTWLWHVTTLADERIIVDNAKGVNSKFYEPGPFSTMEDFERNFVDWYVDQMKRSLD